ncbi:MAG: MBL fold metallo-hydrolase [Prolixibacteraceae bacterium]|nr:MBL fold metallo-hydrolase [Prolixibacteraceae bacterium]
MIKLYNSIEEYHLPLASANRLKPELYLFRRLALILVVILFSLIRVYSQKPFDYTVSTSSGELKVTVLGHSSVKLNWGETVIYVDPYQKTYDFSQSTAADIILITHQDDDHFDYNAINKIKSDSTLIVYTQSCFDKKAFSGTDTIMGNGDSIFVSGIGINAVPAYNIVNSKHVKGVGNGYILTFGGKRVYLAGDTEIVPEMAEIKDIAIAFFGYSTLNMTTSMFIEAANMIKPEIVIPYHYDNKDISGLIKEFEDMTDIKILTGSENHTGNYAVPELYGESYLFPNPATDFCFVVYRQEAIGTLKVFSLDGKLIMEKEFEHDMPVDISGLKKGLYIALAKTDKFSKSFKLTIN